MKSRSMLIVLGLVILVAVVLLTRKGSDSSPEPAAGAMTNVPVSITVAGRQVLESNLSFAGTISANNDVNVISETQGSVRALHLQVGTPVTAGKVLVEIEDAIARSSLSTAEISHQKAARDFERNETLFQEGSISPAQLDAVRLALKAAENQLNIARRQLENTRIKTPISGIVNARFVNLGTMVQPGMPVANIVDITTLKVRVNVNERGAFQVKPGDRVDVITDVYPGHVFQARIDNIASKADEAHTYPVEIHLSNDPKFPLKSGMFCRVSFTTIGSSETLVVPRTCLVGSIKNASVYVLKGGAAFLQPVVIGQQTNELLEVVNGLSAGDTVVTRGQNNLTDHARVDIIGAP
jgi:RND family efflux transporter MFP subunit